MPASFDVAPFESLLRHAIGLNPSAVGRDEIVRAVAARLRDTGAPDVETYLARAADDERERDALIDLVVVRETWFFREPSAFAALRAIVARRSGGHRPLRVLSVPCASGEEAYSIAIVLCEAGRSVRDATVHAADVSRSALAQARRGEYDARAVRHVDAAIRYRWFNLADGTFRIDPAVRRFVTFDRANLVDPQAFAGHAPYDVIFCRNVLIYFDAEARDRTLATLARLLAPNGILFTGHAEGGRVVAPRFVSAGVRGAFAYRHAATAATPTVRDVEAPASTGADPILDPPRVAGPDPRSAPADRSDDDRLTAIATLAGSGALAQARDLCLETLALQPGLAHAHYWLGVIEHGRGRRAAAEASWRRAIYLDPRHEEALQQLAVERDRQGDAREAARLRRRAELARQRDRQDEVRDER